jgi:thiamine biosynthesis protein ThiS
MEITLNNRPENIEQEGLSIQELIELKNFTFKLLVTKINGTLVKKNQRSAVKINNGDKVDVIHLISGG